MRPQLRTDMTDRCATLPPLGGVERQLPKLHASGRIWSFALADFHHSSVMDLLEASNV
jgi:hypothetical protein